jgi:DNA-binding transcriptional LysR family regulator
MSLQKSANIKHLLTFQKVARSGNVSMAASELFLSQSATSIQLANLEAAVGTKLINRTGRGVRLTDAGQKLLVLSERMLALWQEISDEMETYLGDFSGTLRIDAVTTAEYWLPHVLVNFVNRHPNVKLKLQVANKEEIVRSLAADEIDLAVMGNPPEDIQVIAQSFANNPTAFLASPKHPLMQQPQVSMAMLASAGMLVREKGSGARASVEKIFKAEGLKLHIGSELSSNESIKQMCIAGLSPAYLSLHSCALEIRAGLLAVLPLENNPMNRRWIVVHTQNKSLSRVASVFMADLIDNGATEIDRQLEQISQMPLESLVGWRTPSSVSALS